MRLLYMDIFSLDKNQYFIIIFILVTIIGIIKLLNLSVQLVLGIIIGIIVIYFYLNSNMPNSIKSKYNELLIQPDEILLQYPDIINFVYSLQDYYEYNMDSFQDLITELNSFFLLYKKLPEDCAMIYDNLSGSKLKLINILSTYIYSVPDEKPLIPKIREFESLLDKYLKDIECNIDDFKRYKPHPKNIYDYK